MPGWPRKEAERYLRRVARKNAIKVRWFNGPDWHTSAEAYITARMVVIPKPYTPGQFLVAMHELGHILGEVTYDHRIEYDLRPGLFWLLMEASAWAWAVEHIPDEFGEHLEPDHFLATVGKGMASHTWDVARRAEDG